MNKIGTSVVAIAALIGTPAFAADLPFKAPPAPALVYNWSGLYVGADVGARWTDPDLSITAIDELFFAGPPQHDFPKCTTDFSPCSAGASFKSTAFRAGTYAGYNWQFGERWVAGFEGDWGWADNSSTKDGFKYSLGGFQDSSFTIKSNWDASARARIGYLVTPAVLVFAAGGAAWLHTEITSDCGAKASCFPGEFGPPELKTSTTWTGWTIGGGIEAMLIPNWIVRAEYRYADYGTKSFLEARPCPGAPSVLCGQETSLNVAYDVSMRSHIALVGIGYRFGGPR